MMRKAVLFVVFALLATSAYSYSLDFTLVNNTNQTIVDMWGALATVDDSPWTEFKSITVSGNGGSEDIIFKSTATGAACLYDMRVMFSGGDRAVLSNVNLCNTRTLTIGGNPAGRVTYSASHD